MTSRPSEAFLPPPLPTSLCFWGQEEVGETFKAFSPSPFKSRQSDHQALMRDREKSPLSLYKHIILLLGGCSKAESKVTQPPTVACKNGSSVGIHTHCIHIFARLAQICMPSRWLLTKFMHWTSVGSLLRVRCWLGQWLLAAKNFTVFFYCKSVSITVEFFNMAEVDVCGKKN